MSEGICCIPFETSRMLRSAWAAGCAGCCALGAARKMGFMEKHLWLREGKSPRCKDSGLRKATRDGGMACRNSWMPFSSRCLFG
jgi:hypothetical protein